MVVAAVLLGVRGEVTVHVVGGGGGKRWGWVGRGQEVFWTRHIHITTPHPS